MKRRQKSPGTLRFIIIAVIFMLLIDQFVFGGKRSYIEDAKRQEAVETVAAPEPVRAPPVRVTPDGGKDYFEAEPEVVPVQEPESPVAPKAAPPVAAKPEPQKSEAVPMVRPHIGGAPKIAIIIDDLGMDIKRSREAMALPAPVTLAFLPYAPKTKELAAVGKKNGHTLIIHVPMEAVDKRLDIGPGGLREGMDPAKFDAAFAVMLNSFSGYEGINNHMGSRLTQDRGAMDRIMKVLAAKHLFFVDSKTIQSSVAAHEAAANDVKYAERDVFLDHVETLDAARAALAHTEAVAKRRGYAIAIGHPKDNTLAALHAWIPTLKAKGIELVSVRELLATPEVAGAAAPAQVDVLPTVVTPEQADVPRPVVIPAEAGIQSEEPAAPSVDLFPEESGVVPNAAWPGEERVTPSDPASSGQGTQHLPPPGQSPSP